MKHHDAAAITPDRLASRRDHLMTEITRAPETLPLRASQPRRRLRLAVAGLTVAVLTAGVSVWASTGGGPTGHGPAAFAIEKLPTGPLEIRIVDTTASAKQMTDQLHADGFDITVTTMPSNAQVAGEWLTFSSSGGDPADDTLVEEQMSAEPHVIEIPPALLRHRLDFGIARLAGPGETVEVAGLRNALRPAGPLFCLRLADTDPTSAAKTLSAAGYRVHFDARLGNFRTATTTPPAGRVVQAYLWDPIMGIPGTTHDVYLTVRDPQSADYASFLWLGWPKAMQDSGVRDYSGCPASS